MSVKSEQKLLIEDLQNQIRVLKRDVSARTLLDSARAALGQFHKTEDALKAAKQAVIEKVALIDGGSINIEDLRSFIRSDFRVDKSRDHQTTTYTMELRIRAGNLVEEALERQIIKPAPKPQSAYRTLGEQIEAINARNARYHSTGTTYTPFGGIA